MLKQFFKMLSKQDLLTQALNDTHEMAEITKGLYDLAIKSVLDDISRKVNQDEIDEIKKKDYLINHFEKSIRKKVFEHVTITEKEDQQLYTSFVLMTIVMNLERIGDYSKNLAEVGEIKHMLIDLEWNEKLLKYSERIKEMFRDTLKAFKTGDYPMASGIIDKHFKIKVEIDEDLYDVATKEPSATVNYVGYGLFLRYSKRISAHLMNIATCVTNPIDKIGYYVGAEGKTVDDE